MLKQNENATLEQFNVLMDKNIQYADSEIKKSEQRKLNLIQKRKELEYERNKQEKSKENVNRQQTVDKLEKDIEDIKKF